MALYTVHRRAGDAPDKATFVRDGFSFGAFVLGIIWALWHRMWLVAAVLLLLDGALSLAAYFGLPETVLALTNFAIALIFGFEARGLQRLSLAAAGKPEVAVTAGQQLEEAELRYFLTLPPSWPAAAPGSVPFPASPGAHDALGLFGKV